MQRDYAVSLARILGMLCIVACHIGNYFSNSLVSQLFNVGVPLFFVISGGLYANRKIEKPHQWLANRILRLYMPLMAWFLYTLISFLIQNGGCLSRENISSLALIFFNLQGLNHLFPKFRPVNGPWFFTIIMLCYLLLIPFKKLEQRHKDVNSWPSLIAMFVVTALASVNGRLDLSGIFCFFGGGILTALGYNDKEKNHSIVTAGLLVIGSCCIRIVGKVFLDDLWIYNDVIVLFTHFAFAFGILKSIRWLRGINKTVFDNTMSSKPIEWIDRISVYVYCFHGAFISGSFSIFGLNMRLIPSVIMVYIASFALSTVICSLFEPLRCHISKMINQTS